MEIVSFQTRISAGWDGIFDQMKINVDNLSFRLQKQSIQLDRG